MAGLSALLLRGIEMVLGEICCMSDGETPHLVKWHRFVHHRKFSFCFSACHATQGFL